MVIYHIYHGTMYKNHLQQIQDIYIHLPYESNPKKKSWHWGRFHLWCPLDSHQQNSSLIKHATWMSQEVSKS